MSSRSQNPLLYLFCKAWEYAEEQRRKVGLFWFMFIISETIDTFFLPFVWAKMIDVVTKQGIGPDSIQTLGILLFCVFLRTNVVWGLHGPARFMEQNTAFMIRTNYRRRLLQGLMVLPLEWHTEHHSGETTDKINKGTNALYDFSENISRTNVDGLNTIFRLQKVHQELDLCPLTRAHYSKKYKSLRFHHVRSRSQSNRNYA